MIDMEIIDKIDFEEPSDERCINGGTQKLFRFSNGFGASVVKHSFSYGKEKGLWELAVIEFKYPTDLETDEFSLCYSTDITDDVIGSLTIKQAVKILHKIQKLTRDLKK